MAKSPTDSDLVEQIAEQHGIETDALEDAVAALEDAERVCGRCGDEHEPGEVDVRPRVMPDGSAEVVGHDCWALEVSEVTPLSQKEALAAALLATDEYTHSEVGSMISTSQSNISNYKRRTVEKVEGAEIEIARSVALINAVDPEEL